MMPTTLFGPRGSKHVMVTTFSMEAKLSKEGFKNLKSWSRGVDTTIFTPQSRSIVGSKPKLLYVGRVAVEKNLEAFLKKISVHLVYLVTQIIIKILKVLL